MVDIFPTWMTLRCIFLTPDLKLPNSDDFGRDLGLHVKKKGFLTLGLEEITFKNTL